MSVPCVCLVVLDGWGLAPDGPGNAVALADTPVFDELWERRPHTTLTAKGEAVGGEPPAVEHDEADGGDGHAAAASTIAAKSPGSRLAPPTSAPSTSSSASSSAALSGLHEPP